jgi:hypothetical protein
MKRYKGEIRYRKSGRTAWKCDHYHRTTTEAGDCAADHMAEVVVLHIQPFKVDPADSEPIRGRLAG